MGAGAVLGAPPVTGGGVAVATGGGGKLPPRLIAIAPATPRAARPGPLPSGPLTVVVVRVLLGVAALAGSTAVGGRTAVGGGDGGGVSTRATTAVAVTVGRAVAVWLRRASVIVTSPMLANTSSKAIAEVSSVERGSAPTLDRILRCQSCGRRLDTKRFLSADASIAILVCAHFAHLNITQFRKL